MKIGKWEKVKTKKCYEFGKYYSVIVDEVITPGGKKGEYSVIRMNPYSIIIPIDEFGKVYFVKQHRYPTNNFTLELPMGNTDGEDALSAAKRELEEEVGLISDEWKKIGKINEANGVGEITGIVYLAKNVRSARNPKKDLLDENLFEIKKFSLDEIKQMIVDEKIEDAATISAMAKFLFSNNF